MQAREPEPTLAFRGRKTSTLQVRRKLATNAVMQNYKPPPTVPVVILPSKGQRTLDELFKKQNAVPIADTAVPIADTATDMLL